MVNLSKKSEDYKYATSRQNLIREPQRLRILTQHGPQQHALWDEVIQSSCIHSKHAATTRSLTAFAYIKQVKSKKAFVLGR
jgi:hypothetical protein